MKIDIFNHVMPQAYLELVKSHSKEPGMVKRMSSLRMLWDIEHRVAMLREKFPEVRQVLTLSLPGPELLGGPEHVCDIAAESGALKHGEQHLSAFAKVLKVYRKREAETAARGTRGPARRSVDRPGR